MQDRHKEPPPDPAEKARQAEIVLRRPWQRDVFFGALAALLLLLVILRTATGQA